MAGCVNWHTRNALTGTNTSRDSKSSSIGTSQERLGSDARTCGKAEWQHGLGAVAGNTLTTGAGAGQR